MKIVNSLSVLGIVAVLMLSNAASAQVQESTGQHTHQPPNTQTPESTTTDRPANPDSAKHTIGPRVVTNPCNINPELRWCKALQAPRGNG